METALVLGSEQKPTGLRFRQRMLSDTNNLTITVDGIFDTSAGSVQARGAAFKGFVIPSKGGLDKLLDRVDIGVSYATDTDDVYGSLRAKKSFAFGSGNVAGEVQVAGEVDVTMDKKVNKRGRLQLSSKVFSFTDNQDVKLKVGYGHKRIGVSSKFLQGPYGCIKENNWSLLTDFNKYWEVRYNL